MGKIVILDENTSNKIAAGEVVERPASVVKELVENSIDAGAGNISVDIKNGGISYIKVTDNGSGIDEDDVEIAFERHATSKIRSSDDLDSIMTMGFRGEALASIASVSVVELSTRMQKNPYGTYIRVEGGIVKEVNQTGCPAGTSFIVRDLFYNTPARYKFLKKDSTEAGYISDIIYRLAMSHPEISFRLTSSGSTVVHTPGNKDLKSVIYSIYGKETSKGVAEIKFEENGLCIEGYAGKPEIARANRNQQSIFINGRYIKSRIITSAIDEAYKTYLMKNKFPFIIMSIKVNPLMVDVNVHPTKMEVRFSNEQDIFRTVYHAVTNALQGNSLVKTIDIENKDKKLFRFNAPEIPKPSYTQQNIREKKSLYSEKPVVKEAELKNYYNLRNNLFKMEDNKQDWGKINPILKKAAQEYKSANAPKKVELERTASKEEYECKQQDEIKNEVPLIEIHEDKQKVEPVSEPVTNALVKARIIGQVFSTYVLLQNEEEFILIDQHAAHERILYERIRSKYMNNEPLAQFILVPEVIEITHQELNFIESEKDFFNKLGFEYENFGNNSVIIRSIPCSAESVDIKQMFLDVLDYTMKSGKADFRLTADEVIYTVACKAAIKANKRLDDSEINQLVRELSKLDNPYTCPHGRPVIVKITKYEMEKMFKRIV